jgi:methyltransferase (TIGR00027 family)
MNESHSRTAMMAAVARGRHHFEDEPPWILDDPLALIMVGPKWQDMAAASRSRLPQEIDRQARASVAVRSRYAEDRMALGTFDQYVLLGAGLDTLAWRRPDLMGPQRLFEVDHPASQEWKRARAEELALPVHADHVYAPIDFEVQSLHEGLDAAGFDWAAPTLFSWLGVIPYLTIEAVEATLRTVAECRSGSEIAFEYGVLRSSMDDRGRQFADTFTAIATTVGEPVHTGWSPAEAEALVRRCGLHVVDHPSRDDLIHRYFADRLDGLVPWSVSRLLTARVR